MNGKCMYYLNLDFESDFKFIYHSTIPELPNDTEKSHEYESI
jgi:hypothetical protein